jgi:hypothetical protein
VCGKYILLPHSPYLHTFLKEERTIGNQNINSLSTEIKDLSDNFKTFKTALKHFLYSHSFYTPDEYFNR